MTQYADILITNARVYTVDETQPWAEAVAVRGNRIVYVGSAAGAADWRGPQTEVIDGQAHTLLPGFIDTHYHLLGGSLGLAKAQLREARDLADLGERLCAYAAEHPEQAWIEGRGVVYNIIPADQPLDRHFLDRYVPDRPVLLTAFDGHTYWANTKALEMGGILHGREGIGPNSEIVMDRVSGTATGELREPPASRPVRELIPSTTEAHKREALKQGMQQTAALGITSVHNMDSRDEQRALYADMETQNELTLRIYLPFDVKPETPAEALQEAATWKAQHATGMLRSGCVKFFMDGVLESYTGLLVEPYADDPDTYGDALFSAEHFNRMAAAADHLGLQIFTHACGDGAVRRALDGYAHCQQVNGRRDSRHRVEHVELIHPDDLHRFARMGVIAAMQPLHAPLTSKDADIWPRRAGRGRWQYSFAWEDLRQAGATLVYGSDWPVVSQDPMLGIHACLNRKPWQAGDPFQNQTLANTIRGYTRDAAYAEFQEGVKGQIKEGMLADLVLLSADLFATAPEDVKRVRPVLTVCDGRVVFQAEG